MFPSAPEENDEDNRGFTPDEILKEKINPHPTHQPQPVNVNKNPTQSQEIKPQIIEEQPEEITFSNDEIRKGIIMSEILNRRNI